MRETIKRHVKVFLSVCIAAAGVFLFPQQTAYAAATPGPVEVVAVEYYEDQIVVLNNGNTKICYASEVEAARDNWEVIDTDFGDYTMIDISWLSTTVENILIVKGADDPDDTKSRVIIGDKPLKLEISINYANMSSLDVTESIAPLVNIMTSVGTGANPIGFEDLEWRKGVTGQWNSTDSLTVGLLEKFLVKGAYLYFRIRAVDDVVDVAGIDFNARREAGISGGILSCAFNSTDPDYDTTLTDGTAYSTVTDYPNGTNGRRFSNEVKLKIVKKPAAMVYGVDGSKFTLEMKYGKEYCFDDGTTPLSWHQVTDRRVKSLALSTILENPAIDGLAMGNEFQGMLIYVRDYATSKAASSKITEVSVGAQRSFKTISDGAIQAGKAPVDAITLKDKHIYVSYNGNKNMILEIPSASAKLPYEYCVFKSGETFNINKAVWSMITKGTAIKILATKAVDGGTLYVRQKEIKSKAATDSTDAIDYQLASTYVEYDISYPSIPEIVNANYTFTKTYTGAITFTATLNATGKSPYETAIKSIKLGTKDIIYTTSTTVSSGISTMTITLDAASLTTMANCYGKAITIVYTNGTVDKTSIKLTIQSPIAAGNLTFTPAKGTDIGTTAFTMVSSKAVGNTWVYVITDAAITDVYTADQVADVTTATVNSFTTTTVDNILFTADKYLTVFEVNATGYLVKFKSIKITADKIG